MNYQIWGHTHRHAVEEILLHLLPDCAAGEGDDTGGDFCKSVLSVQGDTFTASASVRVKGRCCKGKCIDTVKDGSDPLARKRLETELVKLAVYDAIVPAFRQPPVWGALTGVRPAKLARSLIERGRSPEETEAWLRERFYVSPERAALTMSAAKMAQEMDRKRSKNGISLYVGIPFCPTRCSYCSFISSAVEKNAALIEPYVEALCREVLETGALAKSLGLTVDSLYIGGGTPTTLSSIQLDRLLSALENAFDLSRLFDYTVEAVWPDTITREKLAVLRAHGVTRVSVNPQSMDDEVLRLAGRKHTAQDVIERYMQVRETGFQSVNMDLIAGLAGDSPDGFAKTVDTLLDLGPENITVHTLAVKRGADLRDISANLAQQEQVGHMLAYAQNVLSAHNYHAYYLYRQKFSAGGFENVGWCRPGAENFYNVSMMEELQTVVSLGAGGVSKRVDRITGKIERFTNPKYPAEYLGAQERILQGKRRLLEK